MLWRPVWQSERNLVSLIKAGFCHALGQHVEALYHVFFAVVVRFEGVPNLVSGSFVHPKKVVYSVVGAEIGGNQRLDPFFHPFDRKTAVKADIRQGAVKNTDHVCMRVDHQIQSNILGFPVSVQCSSGVPRPE